MTRCNSLLVLIASLSLGAASAHAQGAPDAPATEPAPEATPAPVMAPMQPAVPVEEPMVIEEAPAEVAEAPAEAVTAPAEPAAAPEKPSVVVTGSFFTRYELREGYAELGKTSGRFSESDMFRYRARLGLATTPVDIGDGKQVILSFAPQASGFWADKGGTLSDGALGMHTAKMRMKKGDYWVDAGRFEMIYGEHLVIGSVGWHETARTFDGLRAHVPIDCCGAYVDAFFTQVSEDPTLVKPLGAGDVYFSGIYAGLGPMIGKGMDLDGYVLNKTMPKTAGVDLGMELTVGSRFKKKMGNLDVRAEAGVQLGVGSVDMLAFQADAEVGMKVGPGRVALGGWYASGDDPTTATNEGWDQLYPTAHKFLGFADIAGGRSNIMGGIARAKFKASPSLVVGADAHLFLRPETAADSYTGIELDTFALHKMGKGLGLRGGYSLFVPNETGPFGTSDVAHYIEVQLRYDLK